MPEYQPSEEGAHHHPITKEALWGLQQALQRAALEQDPQHKRKGQEKETQNPQAEVMPSVNIVVS